MTARPIGVRVGRCRPPRTQPVPPRIQIGKPLERADDLLTENSISGIIALRFGEPPRQSCPPQGGSREWVLQRIGCPRDLNVDGLVGASGRSNSHEPSVWKLADALESIMASQQVESELPMFRLGIVHEMTPTRMGIR